MPADLDAWKQAGASGPPHRASPQAGPGRSRHEQSDVPAPVDLSDFEPVQIPSVFYVDQAENTRGDVVLRFKVPRRYAPLTNGLKGAQRVPLDIDIQIWRPYAVARGDE